MLTKNVKFLGNALNRSQTELVLKQDIRALGLNADGFEILHRSPTKNAPDAECVHVVRGDNLDLVWDDLAFNRIHSFVADTSIDREAFASVTEVSRQREWSQLKANVLPDQNSPRKDCLQFESRTFRHLWPTAQLEAFLMQPGRLAFQLRGNHCYILTPASPRFEGIRDKILDENLDYGCLNMFTVADDSWYPDGAPARYVFQTVEHKRANLAALGEWQVQLDLRWRWRSDKPQRPGPSLSP